MDESYLSIVKLKMGEYEVLKDLDVCVTNPEIAMLLSPALFHWPILTTLDPSPFHHPNTQNHTAVKDNASHITEAMKNFIPISHKFKLPREEANL